MVLASLSEWMQRGGPVMWPILALSVFSVALLLERVWFFFRMDGNAVWQRNWQIMAQLREGKKSEAEQLLASQQDPSAKMLDELLRAPSLDESAVRACLQGHIRSVERFLPTLSTVITAAPMLGILGTVLGVIQSFEVLSVSAKQAGEAVSLGQLSGGISQALITTAAGIGVALLVLLPFNLLRSRSEAAVGRMESLAIAVLEGERRDA